MYVLYYCCLHVLYIHTCILTVNDELRLVDLYALKGPGTQICLSSRIRYSSSVLPEVVSNART